MSFVRLFCSDQLAIRDKPPRPASPQPLPAICVTRPSTGTAGATPAAARHRNKSHGRSKNDSRARSPKAPEADPNATYRPLPKRKSLAGLFGIALKKSSEMLRKEAASTVTTPRSSPKGLRRLVDTIDEAGHHFVSACAGQQPMNMHDTSPDTAAFFSRVGSRGVDDPRIIRSERKFASKSQADVAGSLEDASAQTDQLERLLLTIGQLSPRKRRPSASPRGEKVSSNSWRGSILSSTTRAKKSTSSPSSSDRFRTPLSLDRPYGDRSSGASPASLGKNGDFMPLAPRSPMNRLRSVRQARLSIVHEQEERLRPSSSTFRSRHSAAPSTAASLFKSSSRARPHERDGSIVIGVGVGTPGPDVRSLEAPAAPYDVSDSPPAGAIRASILLSRTDDRGRAVLYPRPAPTLRRGSMRPASTSFSTSDRDSFDFTTELASLNSGLERISFMQALEQSRELDGIFGLTTAIDQRKKVTKCSPAIVKTSKSEITLSPLVPLRPKEATTYRRKPKSSTAPFAGQPGFSLPRPTITWAPPQVPLPPLPPAPRGERPYMASHDKQPSAFSFMSLSSLGEPLDGVLREGHLPFERNYEGISDPPRLDLGSQESLADLHSLLDRADRSLQQQASAKRFVQPSTSTTDSHLLDPQTILSLLQSASRQTSQQSMASRLQQNSSSTLASVNDAEISVVTGPPIDMRKRRQASIYSIRGSKESGATVMPSPDYDIRARIPSDASSAFSYSRIERPTLGDRMFDRDDDFMLEAMSPVSPENILGFRSFQERDRHRQQDSGDSHPYSAEYASRSERAQTSSVTIDLGMAYGGRDGDQRRPHGIHQQWQRPSSNSSCRASDSSDHTVRLSMSLPRVFHLRDDSIASNDEPYGGALDHYLKESPLTTISDRFTAALNAQGKGGYCSVLDVCIDIAGPDRTSTLPLKPRSITRRHRPPRLELRTDNESLPDLISPGDTSTDGSSLFSFETRNSVPPSAGHHQGRLSMNNVELEPTIREESSYGTIRAGNQLSPHQLDPSDWQPDDNENDLPGE